MTDQKPAQPTPSEPRPDATAARVCHFKDAACFGKVVPWKCRGESIMACEKHAKNAATYLDPPKPEPAPAPTPRVEPYFAKDATNYKAQIAELTRIAVKKFDEDPDDPAFRIVMSLECLTSRDERIELLAAEAGSAREAAGYLFNALGWSSGGVGSAALEVCERLERAEAELASAAEMIRGLREELAEMEERVEQAEAEAGNAHRSEIIQEWKAANAQLTDEVARLKAPCACCVDKGCGKHCRCGARSEGKDR